MDREVLDSCRAVVDLLVSYGPTLFERGANAFARATSTGAAPSPRLASRETSASSSFVLVVHGSIKRAASLTKALGWPFKV